MSNIPAKENFNFDEVATIADIKPYVLRFWESEFESIKPTVTESGAKNYSKNDIELILKIKNLLFEKKLSIPKAKLSLDEMMFAVDKQEFVELNLDEVTQIAANNESVVEIKPALSLSLDLATIRSEISKIKENLNSLKNQIR